GSEFRGAIRLSGDWPLVYGTRCLHFCQYVYCLLAVDFPLEGNSEGIPSAIDRVNVRPACSDSDGVSLFERIDTCWGGSGTDDFMLFFIIILVGDQHITAVPDYADCERYDLQ